jgi:hypothetical protein
VRRHPKASFAGSNSGAGSSPALYGRAVATRDGSNDVDGSGASSARRRGFAVALSSLVAIFLLALAAASASAATYVPGTPPTFCTAVGDAAGQCRELKGGVAVDNSNGHVYVIDMDAATPSAGNARIDEYTSAGVFVKAFGIDVVASGQHDAGTGYEVCQPSNSTPVDVCKFGATLGTGAVTTALRSMAIDSQTHILYLGGSNVVKYYDGSTGAFLGEFTASTGLSGTLPPQAFAGGNGIAVDTSGAQHYIYYVATTKIIDKFTVPVVSGGVVTTQPTYVCQITGSATASSSECHGTASQDGAFPGLEITQIGGSLAVDSSGNIFVAETITRNTVSMFDATGAWVKALSVTAPVAVAASASGTIFVTGGGATNATAETVKEFRVSDATEIASFTLPTATSIGVAVDAGALASKGHVYTTERGGQQLRMFVVAPPTVTGVAPNKGPTAGGNEVTITGTELAGATKVEFGTTVVNAPFPVNTATQIKVTAPAHSVGTVDIKVTTAGGSSVNTAADDYNYLVLPAISSISPSKGPTVGGNEVTITGTELAGATKVEFGTTVVNAPFPVNTATQIKVTAPAHSVGIVDIKVTTAGGSSVNTATDDYGYVAPPAVTTTAGATEITQTGARIAGTVNPNGDLVSDCHIDYGTTVSYGSTAPCVPPPGSGSSPAGVAASLSGLNAGTTYHFKVVATNVGGTTNGSDQTFKTADTCATNSALCPPKTPETPIITLPIAPPATVCTVPKLAGKKLGQAKTALVAAHCTLGKVTKPKAKKGKKLGPLVVKSSKPGAGATLPDGAKVDLKLGPKPKRGQR